MRARSSTFFASLVLVACGASAHAPTTPVEPPPPSASASWVLVPRIQGAVPAEPVRDGDAWVGAAGRIRFRLDASGRFEEASQVVDSVIVAVMHASDAWVFVTHAGEILRAEEPLGALTPVGSMGGHRIEEIVSRERRIAALDERSHLFVIDASGAREVTGDVPVSDAAFASATFGVRMDLGGNLFRTTDGGQSWSAIASPFSQPPRVVYHWGERVYVGSDDNETASIGEDGTVARLDAPPSIASEVPADLDDRVTAHFRHRGPASPVAADGRMLVWADGGVRLASGGDVLPLAASCEVALWGARFVARCDDDALVGDGRTPFQPMNALAEAVLDPAGDRYLEPGPCEAAATGEEDEDQEEEEEAPEWLEEDPARGPDAGSSFCVRDATAQTARDLALPEGCRGTVQGIGLGRALVVAECPSGNSLTTVDLATGRAASVPLPERAMPLDAVVAPDGTVVVRAIAPAEHGRIESTWLVGSLDGVTTALPVPERTSRVVVLDAQHLVARDDARDVPEPGETSGAILVSEDGGAHFHPIERAALGAFASRVDVTGAGTGEMGDHWWLDEHTVLGPWSIDFGSWIWMRPGVAGVEIPSSIGVDGAARALPDVSPTVSVDLRTEPRRYYGGHPTVPSPAPLEGDHVLVAGGWIRFDQDHANRGLAGPVVVEVGGEDEGGAFHWTTHAVIPALPSADARAFTLALGVSRALTALVRCVDADSQVCEVIAIRASGEVTTLRRSSTDWSTEIRGVLALADGSLAVHFSSARSDTEDETSHHVDSVLRVAADGTFARRLVHTGPVASSRALARDASGTLGLLVSRRGEARFVGLDGSVGPARVAPSGRVTAACDAIVPGAIDTVRRGRILSGFWIDADVVVSIAPDASACVRSGVTRDGNETGARSGRGAVVARAEGGHVACALLAVDGTRVPLSCAVAPTGETDLPPSSPRDGPLIARLADGTLVTALRRGPSEYRTLTLGSAGWVEAEAIRWTHVDEYPRPHPTLVQGAETPTLLLRGETVRVVTASGTTPLGDDVRSVRGPAAAREVLSVSDAVVTRLVQGTPAGAPLTLPHPVLRLRDVGDGLYAATLCPDVEDRDESYAPETCERRVLTVRGDALSISAALGGDEIGEPRWSASFVPGGDAAHPLALVYREGEHEHRTLTAVRVDARRATPLGPPIAPSSDPTAGIVPLAILASPTRVVYADDTCVITPDLCDVRVVALHGREWRDVAAPRHVDSEAVAVVVDGGDVIVVGVDPSGRVRSARLHGDTWTELAVPAAPPLDAQASEYEE